MLYYSKKAYKEYYYSYTYTFGCKSQPIKLIKGNIIEGKLINITDQNQFYSKFVLLKKINSNYNTLLFISKEGVYGSVYLPNYLTKRVFGSNIGNVIAFNSHLSEKPFKFKKPSFNKFVDNFRYVYSKRVLYSRIVKIRVLGRTLIIKQRKKKKLIYTYLNKAHKEWIYQESLITFFKKRWGKGKMLHCAYFGHQSINNICKFNRIKPIDIYSQRGIRILTRLRIKRRGKSILSMLRK